MKKTFVLLLCASMMLTGCTTGAGTGAYAGSTLGALLGSAIGGIAGGPRGSDIGTLVGMAGGAAVGGALGAKADQQQQEYQNYEDARFEQKYREHRRAATAGNKGYDNRYDDDVYRGYDNRNDDHANNGGGYDDSGFDPTNSGDDVLYDFNGSDYTGNYTASHPERVMPSSSFDNISTPAKVEDKLPLEVRNARFVDDNQDHKLSGDELSKVIFEIYNVSGSTVYDVQPMVVETTGNKRIYVSNSIHVERIVPGKGVRYTAMVKGGKKLKDGTACFRIYAVQGNGNVVSNVSEFNITTARR